MCCEDGGTKVYNKPALQWFVEQDPFTEFKRQWIKGRILTKSIKQARNTGSHDRWNIKIIKQII